MSLAEELSWFAALTRDQRELYAEQGELWRFFLHKTPEDQPKFPPFVDKYPWIAIQWARAIRTLAHLTGFGENQVWEQIESRWNLPREEVSRRITEWVRAKLRLDARE